jgi:antitoxin ParD1/3/4
MPITLTSEQETWLEAYVAAGEFASVEEAARQLIDDRIAEIAASGTDDDMEWARPMVDEARAAITRGETITLEEHRARNVERLAALRR